MPRPPRSPIFWLASYLLWFGILWFLSSRSGDLQDLPSVPYLDKVAHFGYFFGGGGLLSAFLFRLNPEKPRWPLLILAVFIICGLVGWIDEIHQSHTPGRNGNDLGDWLADILGATCGALVFKRLHHLLKS